MGSQVSLAAADGVFGYVGRTFHAAALCGFGGALGCWAGAKVSLIINRPPQHGHGRARVLNKFSSSHLLASFVSSRCGDLAPSKSPDPSNIGGAVAISKEAIVADAVLALGQDVDQEPADELRRV